MGGRVSGSKPRMPPALPPGDPPPRTFGVCCWRAPGALGPGSVRPPSGSAAAERRGLLGGAEHGGPSWVPHPQHGWPPAQLWSRLPRGSRGELSSGAGRVAGGRAAAPRHLALIAHAPCAPTGACPPWAFCFPTSGLLPRRVSPAPGETCSSSPTLPGPRRRLPRKSTAELEPEPESIPFTLHSPFFQKQGPAWC